MFRNYLSDIQLVWRSKTSHPSIAVKVQQYKKIIPLFILGAGIFLGWIGWSTLNKINKEQWLLLLKNSANLTEKSVEESLRSIGYLPNQYLEEEVEFLVSDQFPVFWYDQKICKVFFQRTPSEMPIAFEALRPSCQGFQEKKIELQKTGLDSLSYFMKDLIIQLHSERLEYESERSTKKRVKKRVKKSSKKVIYRGQSNQKSVFLRDPREIVY